MPDIAKHRNRDSTSDEVCPTPHGDPERDPLVISKVHAGMMEHALNSIAGEIERNPYALEFSLPDVSRSQAEAALVVIDKLYGVVEKDPTDIDAKRNLAAALESFGFGEEARIQLREIVRIEPKEVSHHLHLASLCLKQKLPQEAIKILTDLVQLYLSSSDISLLLAGCHRALGDNQKELSFVRRAVELEPESARALECLSACLMERKQYSEALDVILRRIENNPTDATAWGDRGAVAFASGDVSGAIDAYREACRIAPANEQYALSVASLSTRPTSSIFSRIASLVKYLTRRE